MPAGAVGTALRARLRHLPAVLGVVVLIGAIYVVQHEFRNLRLHDIADALGAIPPRALVLSFGWTALSYFVLTFYDQLGTIYAGHKVRYGRVAFASFCASALSHNVGFAAVSGAAVRYRLYAHWGLTPTQIVKTVAFCSLTFGLGGMVLGGTILFLEPHAVPFFGARLPLAVVYLAGALLWGVVAGYIILSRIVGRFRMFGQEIDLPNVRMALLQVLLATVDVAVTATVFWQLLPVVPHLTWLVFLGVYVSAYSAGLATNLPGGIGVFDTAILLGLEPYIDAPRVVGAIIVFRLYYYVIPLFLAGTLFSANEIVLRGESLWRHAARSPAVPGIGRWSEPDFAVASATGTVALCGVLLLCLGVLAPHADYAWLDPDAAQLANQAGQFVPSLIGAGLVMMAIGLSQRVNLAWGLTLLLLFVGAAFEAAQTDRPWVAVMLLLASVLVIPFRSCFYRHARLLSGPLDPAGALSLFVLAICLLALAATRPYTGGLANNAWWAVVVSRAVPNSVRVAVALAVIFGLIAIWRLLRPGRVHWLPWDATARGRLAALGVIPPRRADGLVLGESERAGIPFRRCGRVLLGLGDPGGADTDRTSAVWRLRDLAQQEGMDPAFWRAGPGLLKVYGDIGLTALPLGPDGLPLPEAPDETSEETPATPHYLVCVAERDLGTLLPLLPALATEQDVAIPLAA